MSTGLFAAGLIVTGWAALSLAMPRHHQEAFGAMPSDARRHLFRIAGFGSLAAAFAICVAAIGWEFGPVRWAALLCFGAVVWVLCRNADPRRARWLGGLAPVPGLLLFLF